MRGSVVVVPIAFCLALLPTPVPASEDVTLLEYVHAHLLEQAEVLGVDLDAILALPMELERHDRDGRSIRTLSVGAAIEELLGDERLTVPTNGPAGTSELLVGYTFHTFLHLWNTQMRYTVHDSELVPETDPVSLPPYVYDPGGPMRNVRGAGYNMGFHYAGASEGVGVSTHKDGPYPKPNAMLALVLDQSIDFVGHAEVTQGVQCQENNGVTTCIAVGRLEGNGLARFQGTGPPPFPLVP